MKKGQAALEYLITYGWARILIASVTAILLFTVGKNVNPVTCTNFMHLLCKGVTVEGDEVILVLQNATDQKITINPIDILFGKGYAYVEIIYPGKTYKFDEVTINAGDEFTVRAYDVGATEEISVTYTEEQTGLEKIDTSGMNANAFEEKC